MKSMVIAILVLFSSASSFAENGPARVEPLMGVITAWSGVYIQAHSSGCTDKSSFIVKKDRSDDVTRLTFVRVEEDPCLALYVFGKVINYSFEELGLESGEKFFVTNPLVFSKAR